MSCPRSPTASTRYCRRRNAKCGHDGLPALRRRHRRRRSPINRCPPGGDEGIAALAVLLEQPILPLDLTRGQPGPLLVARIDEAHCIGCTLCIQACPVDAIVGANKRMHTVLADWCTGCDLCVAPCPVDCIDMVPAEAGPPRTPTSAASAIAAIRRAWRVWRTTRA